MKGITDIVKLASVFKQQETSLMSPSAIIMGWHNEKFTKQNILILSRILSRIESDQK